MFSPHHLLNYLEGRVIFRPVADLRAEALLIVVQAVPKPGVPVAAVTLLAHHQQDCQAIAQQLKL
jgi:hypothetical protein